MCIKKRIKPKVLKVAFISIHVNILHTIPNQNMKENNICVNPL